MNILYSGEVKNITVPSVFLAGPSPRLKSTKSWRPEALEYFNELNFEGSVFVPEYRDGPQNKLDYNGQIGWEHLCLDTATAIIMWVPRDLDTMPALTTNVEFGLYIKNSRLHYGRPNGSPKNEYLDYCYHVFTKRLIHTDLKDLVEYTVNSVRNEVEIARFK
jgi:hypothetical protein